MRITPENITELQEFDIFVFGSNELGNHGGGAAKTAFLKFGAEWRKGFERTKFTFAIPTKDWRINSLPLNAIEFYVKRFIEYSKNLPSSRFLVTKIGCGLAGYTPEDIAPMFRECLNLENVWLPQEFIDILNGHTVNNWDSSNYSEDGRGY